MSQESLVSVLMPVYDAERFVAQAVESILAQTYQNFEFMIVDDGSTDRSLAILEHYAAQDARIRLSSKPNAGYGVRLNEMLDEARGDYIARMDADDIALPERFEHQVAFLMSHPDHVVVGSQVLVIDPEGDPLCVWGKEQTHEEIEEVQFRGTSGSVINHPAAMFRRESVLAVGKYHLKWYPGEDLDLFLRLAEHGGRMANLPLILTKYRMHLRSTCHTESARVPDMVQNILQEARRRRGLPEIPFIKSNNLNNPAKPDRPLDYWKKWGWWALNSGYISSARKHARQCLIHAPLSKETWQLLFYSIRGH
jgi:glycosyltransferase involved in cell wall biosynthesis